MGGAIGGAIGFAIAGPVGGLIGLGIGCAVGIPVALLFGEKIHEKYLDLSEWLGNKIFGYKPASPSSSPKASLVNSPQDSPITRNASEGDLSQDKNNVQHEKQQEVKQEQAVKGEREEESSQAHIQQIVSPNIISPPTKLGSEKPIPNVSLEETSKIVADISKKIKLAPGEISLVRPHQTVRKNINEAQTTIDLSSPVSVPALAPSVSILIEPIRPQLIKDDFVDSGALVTSASASYPRPIAPVEPLNSSRSSDSDTDETISTIESQDAGSDLGGGSDTSSDSGSSPGPGPQPGPDAEPGNDADPGYDGGSNSGSDSNSGSNLGSGSGFGSSGNSNQCLNVVVGSAVFIAKNDLDTPNVEVEQVIRGCLDDILSTDDSNLSAENSSHLNIETHKQPANNSISSLITIIFDRQRGIKEQKKGVINICRKKPSILLYPIGNTLNLNHGANGLSPIQLACCLGNFDLVKKMLVFLDQQADEKLNDIAINQINEWMCAKRCYFTELQTQKINYHFYLLENEITRRHLTSGNYKASKYFNLVFKRAFESKGAACSGLDVYYALTRAINLYINVSNQWDDEQLSFFSDHVLGFFKSHLPDVDFSLLDNIEKIVKRRKWRNVDGEHNELANKCLTHLLRFDSLHYYSPLIKFKDWLAWWPQVRTYVNWSKEMDNQLRLAGKPLPSIQDADLIKGMGLFGPNKPSAVTQVGASVTNAMTLFGRSAPQVRNQQSVKVFRSYELS